MYMSYCRYEGTRYELNACIGDAREHYYEEAEYEVCENEIDNFRQLIHNFVEFLGETEILDENGEINEDKLDEVCETMRHRYTTEDY